MPLCLLRPCPLRAATSAPIVPSLMYRYLVLCSVWLAGSLGEGELVCNRRLYTYKVTQSDANGRSCWDLVTVSSCHGRCDSNEISDWRFPYKRSYHPVCLYGERESVRTVLQNCEPGVAPGTEVHEHLDAVTCRCHVCKSSEASCEGLSGPLIPGMDKWQPVQMNLPDKPY